MQMTNMHVDVWTENHQPVPLMTLRQFLEERRKIVQEYEEKRIPYERHDCVLFFQDVVQPGDKEVGQTWPYGLHGYYNYTDEIIKWIDGGIGSYMSTDEFDQDRTMVRPLQPGERLTMTWENR